MYNDETYEVNDYDEDIQERQALIEEAKQLQESSEDGVVDMRVVSDLQRRWKRIQYWESAFEDNLADEFDSIIDVFYGKRKEGYKNNQEAKQKLIDEAQEYSNSKDWNHATKKMGELMAQWKTIGSAGKDNDDALWNEFNEARQNFFDRKHKNWEDMQANFEKAREIKKELIAKVSTLVDSEEWQKTSDEMNGLMKAWKEAGSAGREFEDNLWNEFNEIRQKFYDRRNEYYEALNEQYEQKYEEKKQLVEKARAILAEEDFTRNSTEKMKMLGTEWKKIGSCGKNKEDKIWKEFRSVMDDYFNGLRAFNDQKHEQWRQKMIDAKARKQDQIQNQKRQIQRLEQDMIGLLGERAINEAKETIEDKKAFIAELEADLADIEKTLEQ